MAKNHYSLLHELVAPQQGENWEQELSCEQFFAIIMAYNEKLTDKRRKDGDKLTQEEETALEIAFKSGFSGNFSEQDVINKVKSLCCLEVAEIIDGNLPRKDTIAMLHKMSYDKTFNKLKSFTERSKSIFQEDVEGREDVVLGDNFQYSCEQLDLLAVMMANPEKHLTKAQQSPQAMQLIKERMEVLSHDYLKNMFIGMCNRVGCVVDQEALTSVYQSQELEVV